MNENGHMTFHPAANIFPLLEGEEYEALVSDIRDNGQIEGIVLWKDGSILDGRNRYRACVDLGIDPHFKEWHGEDTVSYVLSLNMHRRHLSSGQRAALGVRVEEVEAVFARERQKTSTGGSYPQLVAKLPQAGKGKAREKAAATTKASPRYVQDAKKIKKLAHDLFAKIESGEITIPQAKKELRKRDQKAKEDAAVKKAKEEAARENDTSGVDLVRFWHITSAQDVIECDAVITDPPYGILDEPWEPEHLEDFTREWATRWSTSNADLFLIFWSQRYLYEGRRWFDESLVGYDFTQTLVWHYPNNKGHQSKHMFKQTWEPVYFYRRKGSKRKVSVGGTEWGRGLNDFDCHTAAVPQSNFNADKRKQHPAQKPVEVMRWLINATTAPGELIVDPFTGSGTTGIAASQLKRRFHGIETDPESIELAERRLISYG